MKIQKDGIKIGGVFIPFTEDQINAIKCAKNPDNNRLDELGFYEPTEKESHIFLDPHGNTLGDGSRRSIEKFIKVRNSFPTEEADQKEKRRREIFNDMLKHSCQFRKGEVSFYICYNHSLGKYCTYINDHIQSLGVIHFESIDIAQSFIDKYGNELHLLRY